MSEGGKLPLKAKVVEKEGEYIILLEKTRR